MEGSGTFQVPGSLHASGSMEPETWTLGYLHYLPVTIAEGIHPVPYPWNTEVKPSAPMVHALKRCGRVGRCRDETTTKRPQVNLLFLV